MPSKMVNGLRVTQPLKLYDITNNYLTSHHIALQFMYGITLRALLNQEWE
jgi:hypothetical protein